MVNRYDGFIDADGHVRDSLDKYRQYLEPPHNLRLMSGVGSLDTFDRLMFGTLGGPMDLDAKGWLEVMDQGGLETAVMYPTFGLGSGFIQERDFAVAFCRAYNNFLSEEYCKVSHRLRGVAMLPLQAPKAAVLELRRGVEELGMVGGMLAADGPFLLGKKEYWPLYAEAQRLGTMLGIHGSGSLRGRGSDEYLFDSLIQAHTLSHPGAQMRQMTSMIFGGVPESFPDLKIAYLEAGCTWVPYWMDRMDEEYEIRGKVEAPHLTKRPSQYVVEGNIWISCEPEERLLPETVRILGDNKVVYASDYPHWDGTFPESLTELQGREDITASQKQMILSDNPRVLYGLQ